MSSKMRSPAAHVVPMHVVLDAETSARGLLSGERWWMEACSGYQANLYDEMFLRGFCLKLILRGEDDRELEEYLNEAVSSYPVFTSASRHS